MKLKNILSLFVSLCIIEPLFLEATPAQVMLIRHAESLPREDTLSTQGKMRAAALVPYFLEGGASRGILHGPIGAIYAMKPSKYARSKLPIETATPLARALEMEVHSDYQYDDYMHMVEEIMHEPLYEGHAVVVVWEGRSLPEVAHAFRALQAPMVWRDNVFDRVWVISFSPSGKKTFQNIPQRAIYGDSSY